MADYIDRDALKQEMYRRCIGTDEEMEKGRAKWDSGLWIRYKVFEDAITDVPTIPVVRCKDCKHYGGLATKEERETSVDLVCDYWDSDGLAWYDFCSYGEKREGRYENN